MALEVWPGADSASQFRCEWVDVGKVGSGRCLWPCKHEQEGTWRDGTWGGGSCREEREGWVAKRG